MQLRRPDPRFLRLARRPDAELDLGEGALLLATLEEPDLDVDAWLRELDARGAEAAHRLASLDDDLARLTGLSELLYDTWGLRGNERCYYDPRNSYLHVVLERRLGIPISLGAVAIEVGRRAGVPLQGIGMPCHFLLRHARQPALLVDPFQRGRLLVQEDCRRVLERASGGAIRFRPELLRPVGTRQILLRMLNNLRGIFVKRGQLDRAVAAAEHQLALFPGEPRLRRDYGLLLLQAGEIDPGVEVLERYLAAAADGPARREVAAVLGAVRERLATWN